MRSLFEIRRLAAKAPRSIETRAVLHDALMETLPEEYERTIAHARVIAQERKSYGYVWFFPHRLAGAARCRNIHPHHLRLLLGAYPSPIHRQVFEFPSALWELLLSRLEARNVGRGRDLDCCAGAAPSC